MPLAGFLISAFEMATPTFRTSALRQMLRRLYPHQAMWYARQHLHDQALGPVTLADTVGLLESLVFALVPREAQSIVHFLLGLNVELCQAGPVGNDQPRGPMRPTHHRRHARPAARKLAKA